jgi:hypothetical protein
VGLVWSNDLESYAGGSIATGRDSHARQVESDDPDKKRDPCPPSWGWGETKNLISVKKKFLLLIRLIMDAGWIIVVKRQGKVIRIMTSIFQLGMYSVCREQEY